MNLYVTSNIVGTLASPYAFAVSVAQMYAGGLSSTESCSKESSVLFFKIERGFERALGSPR